MVRAGSIDYVLYEWVLKHQDLWLLAYASRACGRQFQRVEDSPEAADYTTARAKGALAI